MKMLWEKQYSPDYSEPGFSALVNAWRDDANKVFVLRADRPATNVQDILNNNFQYLGKPVPLAEDVNKGGRENQRNGELWFEVRYDPKHADAYRHSSNAQPLHTDGSYIPDFPNATILASVANAGEGGETIFIDAKDLVRAIRCEAPDLLERLLNYEMPHARSGDRRVEKIIEQTADKTLVNWNYYCVDQNVEHEGRDLAEKLFVYLQESDRVKKSIVAVKLAPGDIVTWKDREVLHGRNSFKATRESERFIWKCAIDIGNFDG